MLARAPWPQMVGRIKLRSLPIMEAEMQAAHGSIWRSERFEAFRIVHGPQPEQLAQVAKFRQRLAYKIGHIHGPTFPICATGI